MLYIRIIYLTMTQQTEQTTKFYNLVSTLVNTLLRYSWHSKDENSLFLSYSIVNPFRKPQRKQNGIH